MNLQQEFDLLNFWINKYTGSYYTISELENLVDSAQLAVYSDYKPKYAVSQIVKEILAPFREVYNFTTAVSGYVIVPSNTNYLDLLDLRIYFAISNRTVYHSVDMVNEDELSDRLNSQIDPVTVTSPVGEQTAPRTFRLYPASAYNGNVSFLRRPVRPVFGYTVVSGRVIVYDPNTSTQLEWRDTEVDIILLKALSMIGINLNSGEMMQWSELKTSNNYQSVNRL